MYWRQNAQNLSKYDYEESEIRTGAVGTEATYGAKNYVGFEFKSADRVNIEADGTTVVNVMYDRKVYSIYFWLNENKKWVKQDSLTITAPYGTDISTRWNDTAHKNYMWYTSKSQNISIGTQGTMPLEGKFPGSDWYTNNAYGKTVKTVSISYQVERCV